MQDALRVHDTDLLIGVAPPKVRIYPEYVSDYLFNDVSSAIPFEHTYDFYLKKEGVNVILIEQELRELKKSGLNLYSHTGFHWNYLAGCEISNKLINKYQKLRFKPFSSLSCDDYTARSTGLDTDVVLILKLLDRDRYIRQSPVLSMSVTIFNFHQRRLLGTVSQI